MNGNQKYVYIWYNETKKCRSMNMFISAFNVIFILISFVISVSSKIKDWFHTFSDESLVLSMISLLFTGINPFTFVPSSASVVDTRLFSIVNVYNKKKHHCVSEN